jgi:hypothetical protein
VYYSENGDLHICSEFSNPQIQMNAQTDKFVEIFNTIDYYKIKDHPNILIAANFWEEGRF